MDTKGNANITFDNEYQYLQIRDNNGTDIGFSQETAGTVRIQEYAKDSRGQVQTIFDETLASKTYVDGALNGKQDTLVSGTNIKTVNGNDITGAGNVQIRSGVGDEYDLTAMPSYNEIAADIANHKLRYIEGNWQVRKISKENDNVQLDAVYGNERKVFLFEESDPDAPLPEPYNIRDTYTQDATLSVMMNLSYDGVSINRGGGGYAQYKLYDDRIEFSQTSASGRTPFEKTYYIGTHIVIGEERWIGTWKENGVTYDLFEKIVDVGALPNNTSKQVEHGITNKGKIVRTKGDALGSSNNISLPFINGDGSLFIYLGVGGTKINIQTNSDRSNMNGYVTIWFTRNRA